MLESIVGYIQHRTSDIFVAFSNFFSSPFQNKDMIWIVIPWLIAVLAMEGYYAHHKGEEVGWNTATANSLVLIFIAMDLLRFLFSKGSLSLSPGSESFSWSVLVLGVFLLGVFTFVMNFGHFWPKLLAYGISYHLTVKLIAYICIVIIYTSMDVSVVTFMGAALFFVLVHMFFFVFRLASKD
jgi:hypothetical protein